MQQHHSAQRYLLVQVSVVQYSAATAGGWFTAFPSLWKAKVPSMMH
jgi:hypothetical protein